MGLCLNGMTMNLAFISKTLVDCRTSEVYDSDAIY